MKKKLIAAAVASVTVAQSTPVFAQPASWGLCWYLPQWSGNWVPCYPALEPGENGSHAWWIV